MAHVAQSLTKTTTGGAWRQKDEHSISSLAKGRAWDELDTKHILWLLSVVVEYGPSSRSAYTSSSRSVKKRLRLGLRLGSDVLVRAAAARQRGEQPRRGFGGVQGIRVRLCTERGER